MGQNVIVVGMPRSGTSLTASVFARHGYHVGSIRRGRYREGDEHNPFGYFEADDLVRRNAQLFGRVGFPHHNTWLFDRMPDEQRRRIATLEIESCDVDLVERYAAHRPWMWKDPRLTYTIGYWCRLVDPSTTAVVVVRRRPDDVVASFRRMGWTVQPDLLQRVVEHVDAAEEALRTAGVPYLLVDYEDYLRRGEEAARRLGQHTGLALSVDDLNVHEELNHAARRAWVQCSLRSMGMRLPVGWRRVLRRHLPRPVLERLLPELRYVARDDDERRRRGIPSPGAADRRDARSQHGDLTSGRG